MTLCWNFKTFHILLLFFELHHWSNEWACFIDFLMYIPCLLCEHSPLSTNILWHTHLHMLLVCSIWCRISVCCKGKDFTYTFGWLMSFRFHIFDSIGILFQIRSSIPRFRFLDLSFLQACISKYYCFAFDSYSSKLNLRNGGKIFEIKDH